jgi:hypothetical protein
MTRPVLADILSGAESWDTTINQNNDKIAEAPFPILLESSKTNLDNNWDPALFDACIAVVWDGVAGNPVTMYASRSNAWEPVSTLANTGVLSTDKLLHFSDAQGDALANGGLTAGVWTPRPFRTVHVANIAGAVVNLNPTDTVDLPEATFWVEAEVSGYVIDNTVARLRQTSGVAGDIVMGRRFGASAGSPVQYSGLCGLFTNNTGSAQTYQFQQLCTLTNLTTGFGPATTLGGANTTYADYKIWQVS